MGGINYPKLVVYAIAIPTLSWEMHQDGAFLRGGYPIQPTPGQAAREPAALPKGHAKPCEAYGFPVCVLDIFGYPGFGYVLGWICNFWICFG